MSLNNKKNSGPQPPSVKETSSYREFTVHSSSRSYKSHIMKVQDPKFDITSLIPPLRLFRATPEATRKAALEQRRAAEDTASMVESNTISETDSTVAKPKTEGPKSKIDFTKVAPFGNATKSRVNLFRKKTRQMCFDRDTMDRYERLGRVRDLDRWPWLLQDFEGTQEGESRLEGRVEGGNSQYCLFVIGVKSFIFF